MCVSKRDKEQPNIMARKMRERETEREREGKKEGNVCLASCF